MAALVDQRVRAGSFDLPRGNTACSREAACGTKLVPAAVCRAASDQQKPQRAVVGDRQRAISFGDYVSAKCTPIAETAKTVDHRRTSQTSPKSPKVAHEEKMAAMSADIVDYFTKHKETEEQFARKMQLRARIAQIAERIEPACRVFIIGSSMTHFGTNCSDLDVCVMVSPQDYIDQWTEAMPFLYDLSRQFEAESVSRSQTMIPAKVPILRASGFEPFDLYGDTTADINVNNAVAIKNTHMLYYYANWDDRVRPLVLVVKEWARRQGINDASRGTLSSYSLTLMVIHFLQSACHPPVLPCLQQLHPNKFHWSIDPLLLDMNKPLPKRDEWERLPRNTEPLAELLIGFLHYYAYEFDYDNQAVTVRFATAMDRHRVVYSRSPYNRPSQWHCLCIEEPFTKANTAHSVYDQMLFDEVKQVFRASYKSLQRGEPLSTILASGFCARFASLNGEGGAGAMLQQPPALRSHLYHAQHFHHRPAHMHSHNTHYPMAAAEGPAGVKRPNERGGTRWVETALKNQSVAAMRARHGVSPLPSAPTALYMPPVPAVVAESNGAKQQQQGWAIARWHPSGAPAHGFYQPQWLRVSQNYGTWPNKGYSGRANWSGGRRNNQFSPSSARNWGTGSNYQPDAIISQPTSARRPAHSAVAKVVVSSANGAAQPLAVVDSAVKLSGPSDATSPPQVQVLQRQPVDEVQQKDAKNASAADVDQGVKGGAGAAATSTSLPSVSGQRIAVHDLFGVNWHDANRSTGGRGFRDITTSRKSVSAENNRSADSLPVHPVESRKKPLLETPCDHQPHPHVIQPIFVLAAPIEALMRSCADQQHQHAQSAVNGRTHSPLPEEPTPPKYTAVDNK